MGGSGGWTEIKRLIPEAFRTTRPEKKGDALLFSRFGELGVLPQASEIVAYAIADAALAEADRVLGHIRENHDANPPEQAALSVVGASAGANRAQCKRASHEGDCHRSCTTQGR